MTKTLPIPLFDVQRPSTDSSYNPLPMQYLGSKARISGWILDQVEKRFPESETFIDLFAGTGSVSLAARERRYRLVLNDLQPYAFVVLRSLFQEDRDGLEDVARDLEKLGTDEKLLASGRHDAVSLLEEERRHFGRADSYNWDWEAYKGFCETTDLVKGTYGEADELRDKAGWNLFTKYYANTYFGVEQCLQLDTIREFAEKLPTVSARTHVIAAATTAMTFAVSSTTHLAQYLKPTSGDRSFRLVQRRSKSLIGSVALRLRKLATYPLPEIPAQVYQNDFKGTLALLPLDQRSLVYVDPPYFKEHYSRYYHVLDTFCLYDYPALTHNDRLGVTTVGRYREGRTVSDFGLKKSVQDAFRHLFSAVQACNAAVAVSYADTSLVAKEDLLALATDLGLEGDVRKIKLMHSGQGQPRNRNVTEYLFLLEPSKVG